MSTHRLSLSIAATLLLAATSLQAEGWSLTSWIPGTKGTLKTSTTRSPLLGGKPLRSTSRSASHQPTVWGRMTGGTKKFFARTKDALTWESEPEPRARGKHTSWDDPSPRLGSKKKEDSSFWGGLFQRDESRPSKTVRDFMSQGRPEAQ